MLKPEFEPIQDFPNYSVSTMERRATDFLEEMKSRRTIRDFSSREVPSDIIEKCIRAAGTSPSGANLQPWHFVVIKNPKIRRDIRLAAEAEEREFYSRRAPAEWLEALSPLGTDESKPFLETAPYLIAIFVQPYGILPDGRRMKHYYALESVGLATGILITAFHHAGLATLTHTPSPMGFLKEILDRPDNERPFLLLVVGYPAEDAQVPKIGKKKLSDIATFI